MSLPYIYSKISPLFRRRRMEQFLELMRPGATTPVLDLGGYPWEWLEARVSFPVVMPNVDVPPGLEVFQPQFTMLHADATALPVRDQEFEVVYSNSVIEHLGTWDRQLAFAREARRTGRKLWVQTPARSFPFEPHLMAPFVHYFSKGIQSRFVRWFTLWGLLTRPSRARVEGMLRELRLLSYQEMQALFPDCQILRERFLGLTKSYIAVRC
jgi:hypothetical protein